MFEWSNPLELSSYRDAKRMPGIYVIGGAVDRMMPVLGSGEDDPYLLRNWPDNYVPHYIGISETMSVGLRGRLSAHCRCKGNKGVANRVRAGEQLFFIVAYGADLAAYETLFLCLKSSGQFEDNVRPEHERDARRRYRKVRSGMTQWQRDYYDNLDYEGRGL